MKHKELKKLTSKYKDYMSIFHCDFENDSNFIFSGDGASYDDYSDSSYSDFSWYYDLKDDNV